MTGDGSVVEKTSRITRSKEQARQSYNSMSRFYGFLSNGSEKKFVKTAIEGYLKPQDGESVLEPGFGSGQVLVALARAVGDRGKAYGIDISDGMVEVTRKRLRKEGLEERVELTRGDAADLPYEDDFFDAVFMSFTLELFDAPEIPVVLRECRRVLGDGGRICVASMSDQGKHGTMMKLYVWSHKRFPNFVDCRPIFARRFVEDAGFEISGYEIMSMWGLPVEIVLGKKGS
jgi:demethylmenaquinone methyltransferase/2-methoxy-6-polyprenyl-1,4-benzoquinol methylase